MLAAWLTIFRSRRIIDDNDRGSFYGFARVPVSDRPERVSIYSRWNSYSIVQYCAVQCYTVPGTVCFGPFSFLPCFLALISWNSVWFCLESMSISWSVISKWPPEDNLLLYCITIHNEYCTVDHLLCTVLLDHSRKHAARDGFEETELLFQGLCTRACSSYSWRKKLTLIRAVAYQNIPRLLRTLEGSNCKAWMGYCTISHHTLSVGTIHKFEDSGSCKLAVLIILYCAVEHPGMLGVGAAGKIHILYVLSWKTAFWAHG